MFRLVNMHYYLDSISGFLYLSDYYTLYRNGHKSCYSAVFCCFALPYTNSSPSSYGLSGGWELSFTWDILTTNPYVSVC